MGKKEVNKGNNVDVYRKRIGKQEYKMNKKNVKTLKEIADTKHSVFGIKILTNSKLKKLKKKPEKFTNRQFLNESETVLSMAPPSLSRDRRIKMQQTQSDALLLLLAIAVLLSSIYLVFYLFLDVEFD